MRSLNRPSDRKKYNRKALIITQQIMKMPKVCYLHLEYCIFYLGKQVKPGKSAENTHYDI